MLLQLYSQNCFIHLKHFGAFSCGKTFPYQVILSIKVKINRSNIDDIAAFVSIRHDFDRPTVTRFLCKDASFCKLQI